MTRRVLIVAPDLFFSARIEETARALGVEVQAVALPAALEAARRTRPDLVILDLHATGEVLELARALKGDEATRAIPVVGYYSHVEGARRAAALAAGVDRVLPRSAFTAKLAELLKGGYTAPPFDPPDHPEEEAP